MPIGGRSGEDLLTRTIGKNGLFEVGQGVKNVVKGGVGYLIGRTAQAMETPGGYLGASKAAEAPQDNGGGSVVDTTTPSASGGNGGGSGSGGGSKKSSGSASSSIDKAASDQQDAAEKAAEEARKAARRSYNAKVDIASDAKVSAGQNYQWIIDTLGSNKQDLLDQVTTNTNQGLTNLDTQDKQTTEKYDAAKQEILSTYRDLQVQQEKIMRGSGMGQSSRSQEAQLKLNNLMGKDLGSVSKNEADSLALIGQAITTLKQKALDTNNSIERETKSKLDKAALDYKDQITAIDNNLMLGANEKEDAYAAAETQLAKDTASITTWASGLKLQAEETMATNKALLDGFIADNATSDADLQTKTSALDQITNQMLTAAGYTELAQNSESTNNTVGQYQKTSSKYKTPEEVQAALQSGEIDASQAEQAIAAISSGSNTGTAMADNFSPLMDKNKSLSDPLLASIYA